jgi:hypothetical protein
MQKSLFSVGGKDLLLKSGIAAIGLFALIGCANASDNTQQAAVATDDGTQNPALLLHMGISDTSYSSQNGDHGGSNSTIMPRRHHM